MISSRETTRAVSGDRWEGIRAYFAEHPGVRERMPEDLSAEIHLLDAYRQDGYGKYDARVEACIP